MTRDRWVLFDCRPRTTPVPWKAGRTPWLPDRPFSFLNPGALPAPRSQAPSQPPRAEGKLQWAAGHKLEGPHRKARKSWTDRGEARDAEGGERRWATCKQAERTGEPSPPRRIARNTLEALRWSVATGVGGTGCCNWPQRRRRVEGGAVLDPTELSNITSRDLAGRSGRKDTPETTSRDAGRASPRPPRQGSGCPGCRHERKTGEGEGEELPSHPITSRHLFCRPFQKTTARLPAA